MQPPVAGWITLSRDAAAARAHLDPALHTFDFHIARASPDVHVSSRGLFQSYVAASTRSRQTPGNPNRANCAAARRRVSASVNSFHLYIARSSLHAHFIADVLHMQAS